MNIDWGWVQHLLESKGSESLEDKATRLEDLAKSAEDDAKTRKRIFEAKKRIREVQPGLLSNIGGGPKLLIGLVIMVILIFVVVKGCG